MGKQPYIPLYIGDWLKDTNTISLEAEGALLKLIFKMWDAKSRGEYEVSLNQLSYLLKKGEEMSRKILQELHENSVLDIEFLENDLVKIVSRRMLKDIAKSRLASENGKKGGRPKKAKRKLNESKLKANSDIDNGIDSSIKISKSVVEIFFDDLPGSSHFENIAKVLMVPKLQLLLFIPAFRKKAELTYPSFDRFCNHFKNWVSIELRNQKATPQTSKPGTEL